MGNRVSAWSLAFNVACAAQESENTNAARSGESIMERSNKFQARLHHLVPGGAHTYSRDSDQYPVFMTPVLARGRGLPRLERRRQLAYIEYGVDRSRGRSVTASGLCSLRGPYPFP